MTGRASFVVALVQVFSTLWPISVSAENRAILIGVSGYAAQIGELQGPANDIKVMWGLLKDRGFQTSNIRVLADGLPETFAREAPVSCTGGKIGLGCPTHGNITRALADLVAIANRGDFVVLYFSGHGMQVPDLITRDEPDGFTEAFVPIDVGRWNSKALIVENLLTDDAVGAAIDKLRQKSVFVWAIFDTCHAGDMARGATDYHKVRVVGGNTVAGGRALGIPETAYVEALKLRPAVAGRPSRQSSLDLPKFGRADGLVGFYAAQSDQLALELGFPEANASGQSITLAMGAFTYALRRALAQNPNTTYRQLARQIADLYPGFGADMPAPFFEGDLDKVVFNDKADLPTWGARWEAGNVYIEAGELDGLAEGAVVALLPQNGAKSPAHVTGYVRVERASVSGSEGMPIPHAGKQPPTPDTSRLRARLEQPGIRALLRVALPPEVDRSSHNAREALAALEQLRAAPSENRPLLVWVQAGHPADIHLRFKHGRIWLLTAFGDWRETGPRQAPSIAVGDASGTAKALEESLWRASRALNLQRVAAGYRQSGKAEEPAVVKSLDVKLFLHRPARSPRQATCPPNPKDDAVPPGAEPVSADDPPPFEHCDIIYVVMRNNGPLPVDVTLLYVDAEARIQCMARWGKARIDPGEVRERRQPIRILAADRNTGAPLRVGRERLIVIGVEKPKNDPIETSFCHLQQESIGGARGEAGMRSGSLSAFERLINEAGLATDPARGFVAVRDDEQSSVVLRTFAWDVGEFAGK